MLPCDDSDEPVAAEVEYSPRSENDEPEPEEDVDLLVDHIQRENAYDWKKIWT